MANAYVVSDLIEELIAARKARGLSQQALGERVGWPQSHVSKVESGRTDLRLSGLIELARALDLELALVPKRSVPLVSSVVRRSLSRDDKTAQALDIIQRVTKFISSDVVSRLVSNAALPNDVIQGLNDTLKRIEVFRFDKRALSALQEATKPIETIRKLLEQNDIAKTERTIAKSAEALKILRNYLTYSDVQSLPKPAYSLDEGDNA